MDERANPFVGDQRTFAKKEKDIKERNAQVPVVWRSCSTQRRPCNTQHRPCDTQHRPCIVQRAIRTMACNTQRRPCNVQ